MRWAAGPGQPPTPYVMPPPPPKKAGGGCLRVVVALLVLSFLACCCIVSAVAESIDDPMNWEQVTKVTPPIGSGDDLGVALRPADLDPTNARHYAWRQRLHAYELGYGISTELHRDVERSFQDLSDAFSYHAGTGMTFTWIPPATCKDREWECVFSTVARDNVENIAPLTALFRQRQQAEQLDARQLAELVISYVQNITYRLPTEESAAFGLLPPTMVVSEGNGDCDSKALLTVIMLRQLGIDANVLLASGLGHAAVGIALPAKGRKFVHARTKYAFVEITAPGWAIGSVPPEYDVNNAWKVIPVDVPVD